MENTSKLNKLLTTHRGPGEVQDWIFSLTPIGVAFVFYLIFIMSTKFRSTSFLSWYATDAGSL